MDKLNKEILGRITVLKKAIAQAEQAEAAPQPDGYLRISINNGHPRYYQVTETEDLNGRYIGKKDMALVRALAQKDYTKRFLQEARSEIKALEQSISRFSVNDADSVYQSLSRHRKGLVTPYIQTNELYAEEWQNRSFKTNTYRVEEKKYDTRRGERVRSKSEAILADLFYELGIPYRYEPALKLRTGSVRYPDFALLKTKTREEYYLEHFGLLDDKEYMKGALEKLDEYRKCGIFLGKNLLITYETADCPLDIRGIRAMMKELLL